MKTILENAEDLDVTDEEAAKLEALGLIYHCEGGDTLGGGACGDFYHIYWLESPKEGWKAVDAALVEMRR